MQQVVKQQQKLLTVQAQSLAPHTTPQQSAAPSLHNTTRCSTQRKAKRSILDGSCFSTPNPKRPADNALVRDLQRKVKTLEAEIEKMKKEHFLQLKQKDEFIRGLINMKNSTDPEAGTTERRVFTGASLGKAQKDASSAGEQKSPSHRCEKQIQSAKANGVGDPEAEEAEVDEAEVDEIGYWRRFWPTKMLSDSCSVDTNSDHSSS